MRSSILWVLFIIYSILLILSLIFFSPSRVEEFWLVMFSSWLPFRFWNCCIIRFMSSLNWIWLATMVFSSSWVFIGSLVFGCSSLSTMVMESSEFLWHRLSCKSNMKLRCCNYKVPSMLTCFSSVIGLELELLAWLSFLDSVWSHPFNLNQILP